MKGNCLGGTKGQRQLQRGRGTKAQSGKAYLMSIYCRFREISIRVRNSYRELVAMPRNKITVVSLFLCAFVPLPL